MINVVEKNEPEQRYRLCQRVEFPLLSRIVWETPLSCVVLPTWQWKASEDFAVTG